MHHVFFTQTVVGHKISKPNVGMWIIAVALALENTNPHLVTLMNMQ
jgi:hypothetical protein